MYTGPGTFQDFLKRTIRNCLALNGKDPETYAFEFPGKSKSQKDQQRLKILLQNETSNEPIERDAIDIHVNENDAAEALAPKANYIPQGEGRQKMVSLASQMRPRYHQKILMFLPSQLCKHRTMNLFIVIARYLFHLDFYRKSTNLFIMAGRCCRIP